MATAHLNGPTTATGEERIRDFLKSREEELEYIDGKIKQEKTRMKEYKKAISNLESVIPDGKRILEFHEENLASLNWIQSRLNHLPAISKWHLETESKSEALCAELRSAITTPGSSNVEIIEKQVEVLGQEVRNIRGKIRQLEQELADLRRSYKLSAMSLDRLISNKASVDKDIRAGKEPFRPIWRTPADIWVTIFEIVQAKEFVEYVKTNDQRSLRAMVHVLSHVCQYWRSVIFTEPSLWTIVYAPPTQAWKEHEYDFLIKAINKSNRPITLLTNVAQTFRGGYNPTGRQDREGRSVRTITPNQTVMPSGRKFSVHFNTSEDQDGYMKRIAYSPFRHATEVTLSATSPMRYNDIFKHLSLFQETQILTIINDRPQGLPASILSRIMPHLRTLKLYIKALPSNFAIAGYLPSSLQELYIQHEVGSTFPTLPTGIQLSALHTLGISSNVLTILQQVIMDSLRTLVLYGPVDSNEEVQIATEHNAEQIYRRLIHLEINSWKEVVSISYQEPGWGFRDPWGEPQLEEYRESGYLSDARSDHRSESIRSSLPYDAPMYFEDPQEENLAFHPELREEPLRSAENYDNTERRTPDDIQRSPRSSDNEWSMNTSTGAVALLYKMTMKSPALHSIKFMDSYVDGRALVKVLKDAAAGSEEGSQKYLKEITFSGASGITRSECDQIQLIVDRLNIYV